MTNITDPTSGDPRNTLREPTRETVAPRLRELLDEPGEQVQGVTITRIESQRRHSRIDGEAAAAILAPVFGILTLGLLNLFVPIIDSLGLRELFFGNGLSNLTVVLTLGAWLMSWVALYEAWRERTVSAPKLYVVSIIALMIAACGFIPAIYRFFEI